MAYTTLIGANELAQHLGDPLFAIVDCRFSLEDPGMGEREYTAAHIPGAIYAHLDRDLSGLKNGKNGRHPLPASHALVHTFSQMGVDGSVQVVAYGARTDMFPARLWWLLRWLGHEAVAVLDGGIEKWREENRPTVSGTERREARTFAGRPHEEMIVDADATARLAENRNWAVVDARAPERYRGEVEPADASAGHIPGASNRFFKMNLDADGRLLNPTALRHSLDATIGATPPDRVVCYCGSGVSACHNLLALEHAGLRGAKLYPGSWSEWSSDPGRPVETGDKK